MSHKHAFSAFLLTALTVLSVAGAGSAFAKDSSGMTKTAGGYTIALKVLPAAKFVSKAKANFNVSVR